MLGWFMQTMSDMHRLQKDVTGSGSGRTISCTTACRKAFAWVHFRQVLKYRKGWIPQVQSLQIIVLLH